MHVPEAAVELRHARVAARDDALKARRRRGSSQTSLRHETTAQQSSLRFFANYRLDWIPAVFPARNTRRRGDDADARVQTKHEVRLSRQVAAMQPVTIAEGMDDQFASRSRSAMRTFFFGYNAPASSFSSSRFSTSQTPIAFDAIARKSSSFWSQK